MTAKLITDSTKYGEKYKRFLIKSNIFYGDVEIAKQDTKTEISGASFKFSNKQDLKKFISRLIDASKFFDKKVF